IPKHAEKFDRALLNKKTALVISLQFVGIVILIILNRLFPIIAECFPLPFNPNAIIVYGRHGLVVGCLIQAVKEDVSITRGLGKIEILTFNQVATTKR